MEMGETVRRLARYSLCALVCSAVAACNFTGDSSGSTTDPTASAPNTSVVDENANSSSSSESASSSASSESSSSSTSSQSSSSSVSATVSISGTPGTQAEVGQAYSFTPSATAPSGGTLSFSVQNKPSWASFSIATGELSGTPTSTDVGTDASVTISASDGSASAALPAFNITVAAVPTTTTGSATLGWTAPTTNTDGSALTDLAGYIISYGTSATALDESVTVTDPSATSYTLQDLAAGTWYFAVTAYASDGTQSAATPTVSAPIT